MKVEELILQLRRKDLPFRMLFIFGWLFILLYILLLFFPWNLRNGQKTIQLTIERGMTPQSIAFLLKTHGVIREERSFLWCAKLMGISRKLQAGKYQFKGQMNNYHILQKLYEGEVVMEQLTFPEGMRATEIAETLKKHLNIDSTRFMILVHDPHFCQSISIVASSLEGYLYPDTYRFHCNAHPEEILSRMVMHFKDVFVDSLRERADYLEFTVHDVVTLASIVEGEAMIDSERAVIAALYLNRLEKGMRLQADPTIQYLIENGPRRLLKKDLEIDSPYNTYRYSGLPPGPVNNPGIVSMLAVLYPASVDYLYMVANGDGSHTFSCTIDEHLRAKKRFDQIRKKIRKQ